MSAPLPVEAWHQLDRAESRWLDEARARIHHRGGAEALSQDEAKGVGDE